MAGQIKTIIYLFIYRIIMAILTRNYDYPDEYWQGNQVAHYIHYGYGYLTWQWTLSLPLRNPIYPYLLSLSYYFTDIFNIQFLIPFAPRLIIQVPFAVLTDYYLIKILKHIYGKINSMMLLCVFGNWYYASTLVRIYFNSFETGLTVIAYYYWLINDRLGSNNVKDLINRAIVSIAYVSRPTSVMAWSFIWPYQLYQIIKIYGILSKKSILFFIKNIINLLLMALLSCIIGSLYFNKLTLTQANFIKFNFIQKWALFYGRQPKYFYFFVSMPFIVNFGLLFMLFTVISIFTKHGVQQKQKQQKKQKKQIKIIFIFVIYYLIVSSLTTHKQHRFIFPIIPFALILTTYFFKQGIKQHKLFSFKITVRAIKCIMLIVLLTNLAIFIGFNGYGKSSHKQAWSYIGQQIQTKYKNRVQNQIAVIVMGQSHFMPGYTLLHKNITYIIPNSTPMKMIFNRSQHKYLIEDPSYLYQILTDNGKIKPDFIIAQGRYLQYTSDVLRQKGYEQTKFWRYFTLAQQMVGYYDFIAIFQPINNRNHLDIDYV